MAWSFWNWDLGLWVFGVPGLAFGEGGSEDLRLEFGDLSKVLKAFEASTPPPRCRLQPHHGGR